MSENFQPGMHVEKLHPAEFAGEPLDLPAHLDADQLNAFVEGVLPEHERSAALAHIADCARCRDIVFLAQQAQPVPEPVAKPASSWRSWLSSSPFLIAATAGLACVLLVTVTVHLHHGVPQSSLTTAKVEAPVAVPAPVVQRESIEAAAVPAAPPKIAAIAPRTAPPSIESRNGAVASLASPPSAVPQGEISQAQGYAALPLQSRKLSYGPAPTQQNLAGQQNYVNQAPLSQSAGGAGAFDRVSPGVVTGVASLSPVGGPIPVPPPPVLAPAPQAKSNRPASADSAETVTVSGSPLALQVDSASVSTDQLSMKTIPPAKPDDKMLPSHEQVVSVAARGERVLAVDAKGTVFVSQDSGHNWTLVMPYWVGKAVRVTLSQRSSTTHSYALSDKANDAATPYATNAPAEAKKARSAPSAPVEATPFQLTTESGQVWVSTDGLTWKER